ncbi:lectin [Thermogemmatispora tikiterensis]|uniref:lectin n=1 Tax=Thermogemmatispora tikiterensis TaxID=1825093 RepID=UPI000DD7BCB2|nr:lectin [Thermogemmatispora tikiterensis]
MRYVTSARFWLFPIIILTILLIIPLTGLERPVLAAQRLAAPARATDLASLVDPFTGTGIQQGAPFGGGDTFPGADLPFGMVQWSPDTVSYVPGGYWYNDNRLRGFSLTHLSGAGCSAYGDIPFMPYLGAVSDSPAADPMRYIATFSHSNEQASAGYYAVTLDSGVKVELSVTQRSGIGRFTYPRGQTATMLVNVSGSANGALDAEATIDPVSRTISGWVSSGHFCGASDVYRLYFWASFSQPFASIGTWHNNAVSTGSRSVRGGSQVASLVSKVQLAQAQLARGARPTPALVQAAHQHPDVTVSGPGSGAFVTFDTARDNVVTVRVGLSFVSSDNARLNVDSEDPDGNFDQVCQQAQATWNRWLGEVQVSGGTSTQLTTFYTALYHVLLQPNVFSDINGQYIGFDGQVHTLPRGHAFYANYSGWDIYRSEIQLLALLAPQETSDIIQSMVLAYQQSGQLPKWSLANGETYVMVGDPADPIIAGAYAFGAHDFDTRAALEAMMQEATQPNNIRPGLRYLEELGYLPQDGGYGCCNFYGSAATQLEYDSADFAIGAFAQALGDQADAQKFMARAQDWENLLNPADGYLEPRNADGTFPTAYDPASQAGWVEGNGAQYNWMVPFNLRGLFDALGGNAKVLPRLDTFFTQLNAGPDQPYAFLGNEPTLETPWEYDYAGAPYKTQQVVRQAVNTLYAPGPGGLAGNDDLGEMSSWYVFAALGFFPIVPGTADLVLASPLFPSIKVTRPSGQVIQINAPQAAESAPYVQSLRVNGQTTTRPWLPPSFIAQGGTLDFVLDTAPNAAWGSDPADAPPSYATGQMEARISFSPARASLAPGASTQVSLVARDLLGKTQSISWSAHPSAGLSVSPTSGSFSVPTYGSASQTLTVSAASGQPEGYATITFSVQTADGSTLPTVTLPVLVAPAGSLLPLVNNIGISNDNTPTIADFDGSHFSYSAQLLASLGYKPGATVTVDGVSYTWPNVPVETQDNVQCSGQTIQVVPKPGATQLTFLGSATNGPSVGTLTITYTDGSTQTAQLGFSDWTLNAGVSSPAYGNVVAAQMPYRNSGSGTPQEVETYLFASAPIALEAGKTVASITLPATVSQGHLHLFAYALS